MPPPSHGARAAAYDKLIAIDSRRVVYFAFISRVAEFTVPLIYVRVVRHNIIRITLLRTLLPTRPVVCVCDRLRFRARNNQKNKKKNIYKKRHIKRYYVPWWEEGSGELALVTTLVAVRNPKRF